MPPTTLTQRITSLYVAYAPEFDVAAYGGCQDEAVNNLIDELATKKITMSSSDRPFRCKQCGRRFSSSGALERHYDEHSPPTRCKTCGKQLRDGEYHRC